MPLRYYLYISRSKVDQLFEQVPRKRLGKIAKKLTIDLKVVKAEFGIDGDEEAQSLYAKARILERYFADTGAVTSVDDVELDEGPLFFAGSMPLRWSRYEAKGVVYFSGRTAKTLLGLGGSSRHVVGADEESPIKGVGSTYPDLVLALAREAEHDVAEKYEPDATIRLVHGEGLAGLLLAAELREGPAPKLRFLALPLATAVIPDDPNLQPFFKGIDRAVLGSPVYVAVER